MKLNLVGPYINGLEIIEINITSLAKLTIIPTSIWIVMTAQIPHPTSPTRFTMSHDCAEANRHIHRRERVDAMMPFRYSTLFIM